MNKKIVFDTPIGNKYWLVAEQVKSLDLVEDCVMLNFGNAVIEVKDIEELYNQIDNLKWQIECEKWRRDCEKIKEIDGRYNDDRF